MPLWLAIINKKNGCTGDFPFIYNLSGFLHFSKQHRPAAFGNIMYSIYFIF